MNKKKVRKKAKNKHEKIRIAKVKKQRQEYEAKCVFIKDWAALKAYGETDPSPTHYLEINLENCIGHIHSKATGEYYYLSTHTFYGKSYKFSERLLRRLDFPVIINNWDK